MRSEAAGTPAQWQVIAAFAAVYVIWGSTYLAIRFCIETLPGFLMAGTRFLVAGGVLYGVARLRGSARPSLEHWRSAALLGAMMLLVGNGCVVFAERAVPSGLTALLVATEPLWVFVLDALRPGGSRPTARSLFGLLLGFSGVAMLVGLGPATGGGQVDLRFAAVVLLGSFSWAAGSVYGLQAKLPASPLLGSGMQMLCGGVLLTVLGTVSGDWGQLRADAISLRSVASLAYLVVFGSLVGFTAYGWLMRNIRPTLVATYAYVNPVVAVLLGWLLAGEPLNLRTLVAAAVIVGSVVIMTRQAPSTRAAKADASRLEVSPQTPLTAPASEVALP